MSKPVRYAVTSLEVLSRAISSPIFSGSVLALLSYAPSQINDALVKHLSLSGPINIGAAKTVAAILLAIGVTRTINRTLNTMAGNNWRMTAQNGWQWENEVAVVTGGCSGIGQKVVEGLVKKGVQVAVIDVQALPGSMKGNRLISYYKCDITSPKSVVETAETIRSDIGHPSILVNNAGIANIGTILKHDGSALERIFRVNCMSHWTTTQQFLPRMIQLNKGHIITVASLASFVALPMSADYAATKAGALAFHETLTCELKHIYKAPSVMTTVVHPNFARTPLIENIADKIEKAQGKLLTSDEVADPILAQIFRRKGGQLIIPSNAKVVSGIRGWPTWMQEFTRDRLGSGASESIDNAK